MIENEAKSTAATGGKAKKIDLRITVEDRRRSWRFNYEGKKCADLNARHSKIERAPQRAKWTKTKICTS